VIAPASPPLNTDVHAKAKRLLTKAGFEVILAPHSRKRLGFLAGSDEERARDINLALRTRKVRAILCVRGGYGSGRILGTIDFAALRRDPKILVGCSDITAILSGALTQSRVVSFHGPMLQSLTTDSCPSFTWRSFIEQMTGSPEALGSILRGYANARQTIDTLHRGRATGRLVGGNLSILSTLVGTPYFPSFDDAIVFLEDVGEAPYRIDRLLTHLLAIGALQRARGFALGVFDKCAYRPDEARKKQTLHDVIIDRLKPLKKPIVMGLPFGHIPHNATLPVGGIVTLDAHKGDLIIEELSTRARR